MKLRTEWWWAMPEAFGAALREWRREAGLTQIAAARRAGVTVSTWCRWETGEPGRPAQVVPLLMAGVPLARLGRMARMLVRARGGKVGRWSGG